MSVKGFLEVWGFSQKNDFRDTAKNIPDRGYETYADRLDAIDTMVKVSTNIPPLHDSFYYQQLVDIEQKPENERHEAYETLLSFIANNHPHGMGADVYEKVSQIANSWSLR